MIQRSQGSSSQTSMCVESPGDYSNADSGSGGSTLWSWFCISDKLPSDVTAADLHIDHISGGKGSTIKNILADLIAMSRNKYWPQLGLVPAVQ